MGYRKKGRLPRYAASRNDLTLGNDLAPAALACRIMSHPIILIGILSHRNDMLIALLHSRLDQHRNRSVQHRATKMSLFPLKTFIHPHSVYRLEYPAHWDQLVKK